MATIIDATVGSASATSYALVPEADAYLANQTNNAAWLAADDDTKAAALNRATMRIDAEIYRGRATNIGQALRWPRTGVYDDGNPVDANTIPQRVKWAEFETALDILNNSSDRLGPTGTEGLKSVKVGSIGVEFIDPTPSAAIASRQGTMNPYAPSAAWDPSRTLPPQAWRLLRGWIITQGTPRSSVTRIVR